MSNQTFQTLKELPIPFIEPQCVLHKHEILICGGYKQTACYSYHTLKNEYKFICEYPRDIKLDGHCVVKLDNSNKDRNQINLLSFGGSEYTTRHTLVMKYVSIWSNISDISKKSNEFNNYNQWVPFKNNHDQPIIISRSTNSCRGARAVIGGINNNLLFITNYFNEINVFDLNKFKFIKYGKLPIYNPICYHCFVSNSENGQGQENKQNNQMLLFKKNIGLLIEYDEDENTFQFHELPVCDAIASFYAYAYVCINDAIFFFGGYDWNNDKHIFSKSVHKYSIRENKWTTFKNTLPSPLYNLVAILNEEGNNMHIIGGLDDKITGRSTHMKTKVRVWDASHLSKNEIKLIIEYWNRTLKIKLGWIDDFDKIIIKYS
ncbi:hypothetical protein RFI_35489 [Reticulomyxa filosa]|uniref:Kelch motif family protein n=1 Tax=Reticulomyxa filosa TaxID=46433 RepID=X6LKS5_RETFI|nr:hypothetical protein RFI_35489 [Reticulomyxa filosa]|eukprot:ETO01951.1 hypothetical protein RFI_35489 [Reticulomyxa filosa]